MAIQQFTDGGFIGKLGEMVGQRLRDKRIIRTYVIPNNPDTPDQHAMRQQFAHATHLAQQAFNINKGDASWKALGGSEFSKRVGVAFTRLRAGATDSEAMPLYPDNVIPNRTLAFVSFQPQSLSFTKIYFSGAPLVQGAEMEIEINYKLKGGSNQTYTYTDTKSDSTENFLRCYLDLTTVDFSQPFTIVAGSTPLGEQTIIAELPLQNISVGFLPNYSNAWVQGNLNQTGDDPAELEIETYSPEVYQDDYWYVFTTFIDPSGQPLFELPAEGDSYQMYLYPQDEDPSVSAGWTYDIFAYYAYNNLGALAWAFNTFTVGDSAGPLFASRKNGGNSSGKKS